MEIIVIIAIVLGFLALVAGITQVMEKRRREALSEAAESMGLVFKPDGDPLLGQRLARTALFNLGRGRKLKNLVEGETDEVRIAIFDYQYTTGSGKQKRTSQQTVAVLESKLLQPPRFAMRPEGMFDKLGNLFGLSDIDFETHPLFSGMFVLQGDNEQAIREFFRPELLSWFENHKGISVEGDPSGILIFYRPNTRRPPAELTALLEQAYALFGVICDSEKR